MFMKDTIILCHSQSLIILSKTRIMDKTSDHVYTLGISRLIISLNFLLTCLLSESWYIWQHSTKYWLTCWSTSLCWHAADSSATPGWNFTDTWLTQLSLGWLLLLNTISSTQKLPYFLYTFEIFLSHPLWVRRRG